VYAALSCCEGVKAEEKKMWLTRVWNGLDEAKEKQAEI